MSNSMNSWYKSSAFNGGSQSYLESLYEDYIDDPKNADGWSGHFSELPKVSDKEVKHSEIREEFKNIVTQAVASSEDNVNHERVQNNTTKMIMSYRLLGHLQADIDPLGMWKKTEVDELEYKYHGLKDEDLNVEVTQDRLSGGVNRKLKDILDDMKKTYCGSVGTEFMHIPINEERHWMQEQVESRIGKYNYDNKKKIEILEVLTAAEGLEKYLGFKYPGAKRFGVEGGESLLVVLDEITKGSSKYGAKEMLIGMAHRGRLNVLVNTIGKHPKDLFEEFEGKQNEKLASGDVKYHMGFSSDVKTEHGVIHLSLGFNPSHLEIVAPVMCGSARARQDRRHKDPLQVVPVIIHGDSAFSCQGVVMETMNMSQTRGYGISGTIHIIINNQIGFTTSRLEDMRSTLYCSDLGKMLCTPIFHVNGDDPEEVSVVTQIAVDYRNKFKKDVIIDLVSYRRLGHNEADEPSVTQPMMYKTVKSLPTTKKIYSNKLVEQGVLKEEDVLNMEKEYRTLLDERQETAVKNIVYNWESGFAADWSPYLKNDDWRTDYDNNLTVEELQNLARKREELPEGFKVHSRIKKLLDDRNKMTNQELPIDWGYAETLAYATLLDSGYPVRLSGQDCGRGTFFHRHSLLKDQNTGEDLVTLNSINKDARFTVINSILSEMAVLGFEYGYSSSEPDSLVIWEAQFGDFANNAQVVFDQFISSGEQKWGRLSGLTVLLPHGYEGAGPEHSSARLERFLQLSAEHNIQVCIPSTPAQVFHMLRRQILRPIRKPLIAITPKSLLRHKVAVSSLEELANGKFKAIIGEHDESINKDNVERLILCSGKVYYDLLEKRDEHKLNIAIIRIEQLYPFPEKELTVELKLYKNAKDVIWCQEEPKNQGAWYSSQHHFRACLQDGQSLTYIGRRPAASPAVGYMKLHIEQQQQIVKDALNL